jgi:hypothetical protein
MSIFEVVFNLMGLVLGLALVEVLSGLGKLLGARSRLKIGYLVPLLGVFVLGDVTSFWGQAYELRALMPSVWPSLGIALVITSIYYLAASLAIPSALITQAEYDDAYWKNKRIVFGLVLACNCASWGISLSLGRSWTSTVWFINLAYAFLLLIAMFARGWRANIAVLSALIADCVWVFAIP